MTRLTRRQFALTSAAALAASPALAQGVSTTPTQLTPSQDPFYEPPPISVERNLSTFVTHDWRPFFNHLRKGAILVNTRTKSLHYWPEDEAGYWIFPTSVPLSPELTKLGRTQVVRKVDGPEWRPTPNMLKRDPSLPNYVGPGPQNPLGTHALYLSWKYYRIHGTNDTRKIGRQSSNGCIGLFNEDIAVLFEMAKVGTQVLLI